MTPEQLRKLEEYSKGGASSHQLEEYRKMLESSSPNMAATATARAIEPAQAAQDDLIDNIFGSDEPDESTVAKEAPTSSLPVPSESAATASSAPPVVPPSIPPAPAQPDETEPAYLRLALAIAALGIPVDFLDGGSKGGGNTEGWQDWATTDPVEIRRRATANPTKTNYMMLAKAIPGGFLFLDDDGGIRAEYEKIYGPMLPTRKHQSPSGKFHYIYEHSAASLDYQKEIGKAYISETGEDGELWSLRMHNAYVIGPGSIATSTKNGVTAEYKVAYDAPIIEIPDTLLKFLADRYAAIEKKKAEKSDTWMDESILEGERNKTLFAIGSALRNAGLDEDSIFAALSVKNQNQCSVPISDEELRTISHSAAKYDPAKTTVTRDGKPLDGVDSFKPAQQAATSEWQDNFKSVGELEKGEVRMLINGFLPEGTTLIGALPGEGKTLLGLSIAKALTTQRNLFGQAGFDVPVIVPVIYLIPESCARAFRKRCEKFHIPDDRAKFICRTISEGSTLLLDNPALMEAVRIMKPVVFLDTAIRFSQSTDENAAAQNKLLADNIIALRQAGAISVIALHHSTKAMREQEMTLENVLRGTGDLAAMADAVYGLRRDDGLYDQGRGPNEINVLCVKPRDFTPPMPFRIAATRRTSPSAIGLTLGIESIIDRTGDFEVRAADTTQAQQTDTLVELIKRYPDISLDDLTKQTGIKKWRVQTMLKESGWHRPRGNSKGGSSRWFHVQPVRDGREGGLEVSLDSKV